MKRFLKIILSILLVLVTLIAGLCGYLGGFQSITIEEKQMGPFHLVYREMKGADMKQVGVITDDIANMLTRSGFKTHKPFDVFFSDGTPNEIGFIVGPSEEGRPSMLDPSIKTKVIPAQKCMVTTFRWKNPLSYMVGYLKVDPALNAYREQHGYAKTWAATLHENDLITYLSPVIALSFQ